MEEVEGHQEVVQGPEPPRLEALALEEELMRQTNDLEANRANRADELVTRRWDSTRRGAS